MTPITTFADRTVALFGLGGSGLATALALKAGGAGVVAWDDNAEASPAAEAAGIATQDLREADWSGFAALVLSPGVPLTHPEPHWTVRLARERGRRDHRRHRAVLPGAARDRAGARRSWRSPAPTANRPRRR